MAFQMRLYIDRRNVKIEMTYKERSCFKYLLLDILCFPNNLVYLIYFIISIVIAKT